MNTLPSPLSERSLKEALLRPRTTGRAPARLPGHHRPGHLTALGPDTPRKAGSRSEAKYGDERVPPLGQRVDPVVEEARAGLTSLSCRKEGPGGPGGPWGPGGPLGPTPGSPWEQKMPGHTWEHSPAMDQGSTHSPSQVGLTFSPLGPTSPGVPGKPCGPTSPWKTQAGSLGREKASLSHHV